MEFPGRSSRKIHAYFNKLKVMENRRSLMAEKCKDAMTGFPNTFMSKDIAKY